MRGTPILLQLFVLYYGLAAAIRLPAFVAALLGLALNYAAYESEIYRAALEAVSTGQLEAARTLGLSERQVLTLVRGPQAFRLALAPMTNDFVALLKDSSLVSVLTVLELTKQTQIFATNLGSWVIPGTLCAALYLLMSLPLSALARRLERRWKAPTRMSDVVLQLDATCIFGAASAAILAGVTLRHRARRARRAHGTVGLRQDHHSSRGRRARAVRIGPHRRRRRDARRRGLRRRRATLRALRRKVGMVFQFHCLFEHLSAIKNVCLAPVHAHGVRAADARHGGHGSCWRRSASSTAPTPCRANCRAARPSAWPSRARWRSIRRCC